MKSNNKKEDYIWVLDFLPRGHVDDDRPAYKKEPLIQGIGEEHFTLLEIVPKEGETVSQYDRVYIGPGEREKADYVKTRISFEELTRNAQTELPYIIEELVKQNEDEYIKAFNNAQPITTRQHTLELFPGIGKKLMWKILDEKEAGGDFESFEDLSERVNGIHHPERILAKRITQEIKEKNLKYRLFVKKD
ncbi:DUF655 domain-containing protein [Methanonatronarchaeum sp. AMET-Sl]|uniref:DUF655 domain-containing protein n=1 Tax=Methanonatronarchaeum sp. AMET-Sl TaxID=3037654 RepID=UPI00244DCA54|nr:DUF655 domain-containing protein [Methanonatronarchaeum sp. AMET-Sl]WGI16760.1 DUF655 domain-containing protein [Methanonatronarchaeum sp. AMET-Sl]